MTDTRTGQAERENEERPRLRSRRPLFVRIFSALKRYENRRRRTCKREESQHQINERMMARWTRVVGLLTAALVIVGIVTAYIFQGQLNVMQGQLDAVEADQRAWVKIEKVEPFSGQAVSGLLFAKPDTAGFLPLHVVLKNVGRSPAFKVLVGAWAKFGDPPSDLAKEEQESCVALGNAYPDNPMVAMNNNIIPVLFPSDPTPYDGSSLMLLPEPINKFSSGEPKGYSFWFYGCVYYRLPGSKMPHQTAFAYWVTRIVEAPIPGGKAQTNFVPWESVPADKILFNPMPLAAGLTN